MATPVNRIAGILRHAPHSAYCLDCLALRTRLSIKDVREATQVLVARRGFRAVRGLCDTCADPKDLIQYSRPPNERAPK
jgi:hypothetical protein